MKWKIHWTLKNDYGHNQKMVKGATMWKSIKTVSETGVKCDPAFWLGPTIEKTNSAVCFAQEISTVFL